ncbi:MAG TPA: calcium-binding protein [Rhodospirillales bacterium]|nr:calcium-binding protein [Rhodospirillales bacterium]
MATYNGTPGNDAIEIFIPYANPGTVNETAFGYEGNDTISIEYECINQGIPVGGSYSGTMEVHGGPGNDTISHDKSYTLWIGVAPDVENVVSRFYGESGNDTFFAWTEEDKYNETGNAPETFYGGSGDDVYYIAEAGDRVVEMPGEGIDTVRARFSTSYAPYENPVVVLPENVENLVLDTAGWYFNPTSLGAVGNTLANRIIGNEISNTLGGGLGNDTIYGKQAGVAASAYGPDADTIRGGGGDDLIYGGGGDADTWDGDDKLYGDAGNDRIFGHNGNDTMYGGTGNDEMGGQAGNDTMYGEAGADKLGGGSGNDVLDGGLDNDILTGREGLDRLTGGGGNDVFRYEWVTDSKPGATLRDVITDFAGIGATVIDRIDLSPIDANTGLSGNQAFAFKGTAAFTGAGQLRLMSSGTDTVIQANTGGSLAPELEIAVTDGTTLPGAWSATDFIL